ncbi:MAG TPA: fatty acid desaturase, partial [Bryobacterales bacterium]|nr:fatty acid desaturase [Bryobacterales bacterium]
KGRAMRSYQVGWNVLVGVPLLMPSFLYEVHLTHHAKSHYGTPDDAEYIPWGGRQRVHIVLLPLVSVISPLLGIARFLLMTPLSWLIPALRPWICERASAIKNRIGHRRSDLTLDGLPWWRIQEAAASLWLWSIAAAVFLGWLSIRWVLLTLAVMSAVALVNSFRILASHRYGNAARPITFIEQLADSVNHPGGLLTELWAPAGLRYHALHHLLPALPYHALGEAHRILMNELPADSLYRQTNSPSLWSSLRTLWTDVRRGEAVLDS